MEQHNFRIWPVLMIVALGLRNNVLAHTTAHGDELEEVSTQLSMATPEEVSSQLSMATPEEVTTPLTVTTLEEITSQLSVTTRPSFSPSVSEFEAVTDHFMTTPAPYISIFDGVGTDHTPLMDKILLIEDRVCLGLCKVFPVDRCLRRNSKCDRCKCDRLCTVYRDCCPDVLLQHGVVYEAEDLSSCRLLYPGPMPKHAPLRKDYQAVIDKCPRATGRKETNRSNGLAQVSQASDAVTDSDVSKCENPEITEPDQSLFVSSEISGLTYRNKYCAACHSDTERLHKWRATLSCEENSTPQFLTRASTKTELLRIMLSPDIRNTGCSLRYESPPSSDYYRTCTPQEPDIISACNVTGVSEYHDSKLEQACGMYKSIFYNKYKNMFCFVCNERDLYNIVSLKTRARNTDTAHLSRVTFSALVDFDDDDSRRSFSEGNTEQVQTAADCLQNEYYDTLSCKCRTPVCSEGKYLTSDGRCESFVSSGLFGYRMCFELYIETKTDISLENIQQLRVQLLTINTESLYSHTDYVKTWCPGSNEVILTVKQLYWKTGTLEEIEPQIVETLNIITRIAVPRLRPDVVRYRISLTNTCFNYTSWAVNTCNADQSIIIPLSSMNRVRGCVKGIECNPFDEEKIVFLPFLHTSQCPFVVLPRNNFTDTDQDDSFIFEPTNKLVSASNIDEISESDIRVCASDFIILVNDTDVKMCSHREDSFDTWTISGLISTTCTCISLFCLLLTFITYCIFPPLRNGSGKNILVLIATLFTAQAFYEFAIEQFEIKMACKVFGIIVHYTWLAAVFSMNACTLERFFKLCFPLKSRIFFLTKKPFVLATVYTFVCPTVIVVINIIVNMATRDDIGYGSPRLCYLNTSTSRIFAFALPMGLVVVFNIILMVITIYSLRRKRNINTASSSQTRIGLVACVHLSMITGLMWLLAFLYEAIPSKILSYFITALIGLQGFMFFVSMSINKRVIALYSELFSRCRDKHNSLSTPCPFNGHRAESEHGDIQQNSENDQQTNSTSGTIRTFMSTVLPQNI